MRFANPVPGYIHPRNWSRPAGNTEFMVTRTCAEHIQTKQGCALDLGNKKCGARVTAVAPGRVFYVYPTEGIVRIDHGTSEGSRWRSDYAHMRSIAVRVGQTVALGQFLGVVSDAHSPDITNFSGCHLHFAIVKDGREVDPWPLLAQNQEDENMRVIGFVEHMVNEKASLAQNTNFRDSPISGNKLTTFPAGTVIIPTEKCKGDKVGNKADADIWYRSTSYVSDNEPNVPKGWTSGYMHSSGFPRSPDGQSAVFMKIEEGTISDEQKEMIYRQGYGAGAKVAATDVVKGAKDSADKYQ